jgi:tetratricopeptide (TPR) repeat protein
VRLFLLIALAFGAGLVVLSGGGGAPAPAAVQRPVLTGTSADIPALQSAVRRSPESEDLRVSLAAAYLQRVRETGDPSFYARAEGVLRTPRSADALATAGELALARHDFDGALALGRRAGAIGAFVRVDALVELGRYDAASRELQRMVDRKPNLAAYARVSYVRELQGDLAGAASAMRLAVAAGGPAPENNAYVSALLGELERRRGRTAAARRAFERSLASVPRFAAAEAGLARIDAERAAGGASPHHAPWAVTSHRALAASIARLHGVVSRLPLPEYVVALGETELAAGRTAAGRRDLALVAVEQRLQQAAGVDIDVELAVFEADHGSPRRAVALARRAWAAAPSVRAADALGWALARSGDPDAGLRWARRALRLGSLDPVWRAHAGLSALAAGHRAEGRRQLRIALAHGLEGYPWQAQRVRRALR